MWIARKVLGGIWECKSYVNAQASIVCTKFSETLKLAVDATNVGAGAVVLQGDVDWVKHPVYYFFKKFENGQKNYCTSEQLFSLVLALQYFKIYVSAGGYPVTVYTNHNPLTFLHRLQNKNQRLLQWSILLHQYTWDIQHIRGQENVIADTLSRAGSHTPDWLC